MMSTLSKAWLVMILAISILVIAIAIYNMPHIIKPSLPDHEIHEIQGRIKKADGVWYKFVWIKFTDGREEWFYGAGIFDEVMDLNWDKNYTFYWKWDCFPYEIQDAYFVDKHCYKIEEM